MAIVATSLTNAAEGTASQLSLVRQEDPLEEVLAFMDAVKALSLDTTDYRGRRVTNWMIACEAAMDRVTIDFHTRQLDSGSGVGTGPQWADFLGDPVSRMLIAAQAAPASSIPTATKDAIVDAWNASIGAMTNS